jgi:hypothetical protein
MSETLDWPILERYYRVVPLCKLHLEAITKILSKNKNTI